MLNNLLANLYQFASHYRNQEILIPHSPHSPPSQGWNVQPAPPISAPQPNAFSGFLRSAATTAAGMAGGALLFQGLENLFDHHGGWESLPREIVDNNFIEQPPVIGNDYGNLPQDNFPPDDYQADLGTDPGFDDSGTFYQG